MACCEKEILDAARKPGFNVDRLREAFAAFDRVK